MSLHVHGSTLGADGKADFFSSLKIFSDDVRAVTYSTPEATLDAAREAAASLADKFLNSNELDTSEDGTPARSNTGVLNRQSPLGSIPSRETGGIDTLVIRCHGKWKRGAVDDALFVLEQARATAEAQEEEASIFQTPGGELVSFAPMGFVFRLKGSTNGCLIGTAP